jgi:hypothetical protein
MRGQNSKYTFLAGDGIEIQWVFRFQISHWMAICKKMIDNNKLDIFLSLFKWNNGLQVV